MNTLKKIIPVVSAAAFCAVSFASEQTNLEQNDAVQLLNMPKNLARAHMGASVLLESKGKYSRTQNRAEEVALIGDDETQSYLLEGDSKSLVIDLGAKYPVHTFAFKSYTASGSVKVMTSSRLKKAGSAHWRNISRPVDFEEGGLVQVSFPSIEARYVRVEFAGISGGEISNVNVSGDITIADVLKHGKIRLGDLKEFHAGEDSVELEVDFASLYAGSNIEFAGVATSEGNVQNMFDENLHSFAGIVGAENGGRTLTVDLKEASLLDKLSLNIEGFEGNISVDSIYNGEAHRVAGASVDSDKKLLQIEFDEASVAEKIKISFRGKRTTVAGIGFGDSRSPDQTRIYEMSLIGKRIFNERDLEEPLLFLPREAIVEISAPGDSPAEPLDPSQIVDLSNDSDDKIYVDADTGLPIPGQSINEVANTTDSATVVFVGSAQP